MDLLNSLPNLINFVASLPPEFYITIASALGVTGIVEAIKHWADIQGPRVLMLLTLALSCVAAGLEYVMTDASNDPTAFGSYTTLIVGAATILYRFVTQPSLQYARTIRDKRRAERNDRIQSILENAMPAADFLEDELPTSTHLDPEPVAAPAAAAQTSAEKPVGAF